MNIPQKIILILLFTASVSLAQQLYFTSSYTEDGEPIGAKNIWEIKPWGSFVYIFLDNEGERFNSPMLYMFMDKMEEDSTFEPYDSKSINVPYNQRWVAYNYKFTLPGEYLVYFTDRSQNRIAEERVTIQYENTNYSVSSPSTSSYYENCKVLFCEKVLVGGDPLGVKTSISLSQDKDIYVVLNNYKPLKTGKLLLDVWRRKNRGFDYDDYVFSKKYRLNPKWPDAYFKFSFEEPGDYKLSIYNENEVYIKSGYITVYQ
jgi:hypothetical protein